MSYKNLLPNEQLEYYSIYDVILVDGTKLESLECLAVGELYVLKSKEKIDHPQVGENLAGGWIIPASLIKRYRLSK